MEELLEIITWSQLGIHHKPVSLNFSSSTKVFEFLQVIVSRHISIINNTKEITFL